MSQLVSFLDQQLIQALGWTFVHTLWQGCVIVLVMIYALQRIPHKDAMKRYTVAGSSMLSMLVAAVATFSMLYFQPGQSESIIAASCTVCSLRSSAVAPAPPYLESRCTIKRSRVSPCQGKHICITSLVPETGEAKVLYSQ